MTNFMLRMCHVILSSGPLCKVGNIVLIGKLRTGVLSSSANMSYSR